MLLLSDLGPYLLNQYWREKGMTRRVNVADAAHVANNRISDGGTAVWVFFTGHDAPPPIAGLPPAAERLAIAESSADYPPIASVPARYPPRISPLAHRRA
jgi:hypothetical protein